MSFIEGDTYSEEIQEVFNTKPYWIVRSGISLLGVLLLVGIAITWFISYPDKVKGEVSITTLSPPIPCVANSTGRINLLVSENEWVKEGQPLAIIENTADSRDMLNLLAKIDTASMLLSSKTNLKALPAFDQNVDLGDVQLSYMAFLKAIEEYRIFIELGYYEHLYHGIERRISYYNDLTAQTFKQRDLLAQELKVSRDDYARDSVLRSADVISQLDYNQSTKGYLQQKNKYQNLTISMINNNIELAHLKSQLNERKLEERKELLGYISAIHHTYKQFDQDVRMWKNVNLVIAPIDGNISLLNFVADNKHVTKGQEIFVCVPKQQPIYGQMTIPLLGSGRVETGQDVNMRFDSFPSKEFGIVRGIVKNISLVPNDNMYYVLVELPDGLKTSYGKEITFKQEMRARGEIITKKVRFLERILNQFKEAFDDLSS